MSRTLGVDFDNTLVCYDDVFHKVARELNLLGPGAARSKQEVKGELHAAGRFDDWTRLQGVVYGPRIRLAHPFEGAREALKAIRAADWELVLVSHKTRHPVIGEPYDLHDAARDWLQHHELQDFFRTCHFELTREQKVARIGALECEVFVDDLPEVFEEPSFPELVEGWLFDPAGTSAGPWPAFRSWGELASCLARR